MPTMRMTISAMTMRAAGSTRSPEKLANCREIGAARHDQDGCLAERADDGSDGAIDQSAAVIEHVDGDALRQPRLKLLDACAHIADELAGVCTSQAQNQSFDRFAAAIGGDGAIARQRARPARGQCP